MHTQIKEVVARSARVEGHVGAIKRMVESERPCAEVLVQIPAVRAALDGAAKALLTDHLEHCIAGSLEGGDTKELLTDPHDALAHFIA
jgi:DNA-binding FrmR family transcriptional regulator